ncbi:DedA family protein [Cysteiniphilum sp. QT6929]|uniref:DedA family protein n=1 Tax=Cysteiniphilum sp. QT6929 TaxID=2975055 RepID=UPI0024B362CC|nr:DedA family protein [Cysteiniphilum sp. QT6929]WHN65417.1 DedA family protein [Cysteiniphilum sp. QT6929]
MSPEHIALIQQWGYWLMFGAAIIEGETFLVLGGVAAAAGMLDFGWIVVLSIIGCLIHDCFLFYLGRYLGPKILKRKPNWQPKIDRISLMIDKYNFWLILGFRFAYGLRTIIPFALGMSKISNIKFMVFDTIGAIIWVLVFLLGGYYFGNALEVILHKLSLTHLVKEYWHISIILLFLVLFTVSFLLVRLRKRRARKKQEKQSKQLKLDMEV